MVNRYNVVIIVDASQSMLTSDPSEYRFEAIRDGKVVKAVEKTPMTEVRLKVTPDRTTVIRGDSFEVVSVRLGAVDENGNPLPCFNEPVEAKVEGALAFYGSDKVMLRGGTGGLYLRTVGWGEAKLTLSLRGTPQETVLFTVKQ